jgi:carboxyl-terminal processing protease
LKIDTEGRFGGLGIEITIKDGLLTVITPIEDTPAWRAGIKANDRIVKINDELTREMTLTEAVKRMRGKPGETVSLTILRDSEKKLLDFKIARDIIRIKDVKDARMLDDGIGYIRLAEFRENTLKEFDNALNNLNRQKVKSLIIDLRNNPGGLLDVAVKVAGRFVPPDKMIAYTKGRKEDQNFEFYSDSKDVNLEMPLAVLINEGSASGSEVVAGVLQDYKRAIIIGKKSFGKGSVQTVIPLGDGSALRLTTSHYFTPSGKIIHGKGITPDILVEAKNESSCMGENAEPDKFENIFDKIESGVKKGQGKQDSFDYKNDPQIMSAVNVLKGIQIYEHPKR